MHKHAGLLRAGIASSGNDHRLGANEAPPAIISVFLGDLLTRILNEIESGHGLDQNAEAAVIKLGVSKLPEVMKDNTDRNRTSPFAFTGNKFEFRAVGSSASTAFPITLLNAAVADGFAEVTAAAQGQDEGAPRATDAAIMEVAQGRDQGDQGDPLRRQQLLGRVGEGSREARPAESAQDARSARAARDPDSRRSSSPSWASSPRPKLISRYHVRVERYVKNLMIEVDTLRQMVDTQILPACYAYHGDARLRRGCGEGGGRHGSADRTL